MMELNDKLLLESYCKAIQLNVDQDFIVLLEKEIYKRLRKGLVKAYNEDLFFKPMKERTFIHL